MDMKEASAMTEASGLVDQQDGMGRSSGARSRAEPARRPRPLQSSPSEAMHFAEHLRELTQKAPLRSLFVAFLLGIWVARRR
jgi:hypothetical protein